MMVDNFIAIVSIQTDASGISLTRKQSSMKCTNAEDKQQNYWSDIVTLSCSCLV